MKSYLLAAALAFAATPAAATVTINFTGQTAAVSGPGDTGGSYTVVTTPTETTTTIETGSQTVSGRIVIDPARLGPNTGTAPNVYYEGTDFGSVDFSSTGFTPLKLSGVPSFQSLSSAVVEGYTFILASEDESYSYIFSIFTLDGDLPTISFDGLTVPDFGSVSELLYFTVRSTQTLGDTTTEINSIGLITSITQTVPEPGTWALMIIGFGMVGAALRYRRAGQAACA